ncbi:hypothetical protein Back11_00170 [Paenibacillus baekrokdamisoli]|uniref:Uncharacterized protein n=1 Tax=Paenibacillus baekrokdamisoli TaxID=1712516 RepID=A0A3G9IKH8_9BACL|nr:Ig-like domain-containing protein [Paenibacillus baekrokdamisoli]MBB3069360.1 uncharacterized protein YjdB [Paenibacillus baekrokdamisoli]BBH18672.1 hypothetical protein Back11_00170 [Paenibacillus baekrokdamisoli]
MYKVMDKRKKWFSLAMIVMMLVTMIVPNRLVQKAHAAAAPVTVAGWTFSATGTSFPANSGSIANTTNAKLTLSDGRTGTYSTTNSSVYTDKWSSPLEGYWQAQFSTLGYSGITLSSKQYGTNGGPRDFKLQYSVDGTNFVDFSDVYALTTAIATKNIALPSGADNQANVYIRWLNASNASISASNTGANGTGTITQTSGNSRIADIIVTGVSTDPDQPVPTTVPVTGVTLDKSTLSMTAGGSVDSLVATVVPSDATDKRVSWSSDSPSVASVNSSNGAVTPKSAGTATITVTTTDGSFQATSTVTVAPPTGKTAAPNASNIMFPTLTTVSGLAGAVAGNAQVAVYTDAGLTTLAGTTAAGSNGSFAITNLTNPESKTTVYVTAQGTGQPVSDAVPVNLAVAQSFKPGDVVFSQIYVNGGNGGAFYNQKFIELYNTTNQDINLNSWSLGYTSYTTMNATTMKPLSGTIKSHGYFLIGANIGTNGVPLPVSVDVDLSGGFNPSGSTGGAIVLSQSNKAVSSPDDTNIVDLIAFTNAATTAFKTPLYWGQPFVSDQIGGGTILRKTNIGSDPKAAFGLGSGWFTKADTSSNYVMFAPQSPSNPVEIIVRNTKYMDGPNGTLINFDGNTSISGLAGSVPAGSTVKAYMDNGGSVGGQATAAADGSFSLTITNSGNKKSVYLTETTAYSLKAMTTRESGYTRVDSAAYSKPLVTDIQDLHLNDANGVPLQLGYPVTIEGVVTAGNRLLGNGNTNFYIQDSTGGINVIGGTVPPMITVGNKVKVVGQLAFTAGMSQFVAATITDSGPSTTPAATSITLDKMSSSADMEPLEGRVVSVKGKVTNIPSAGPDYNVTITDDSGKTAIAKILGTTGIDVNSAVQLGDTVTFKGIIGQSKAASPYTSGYYIAPRSISDIKGELQFNHVPVTKAYIGLDMSIKAMAKYADSVTLYYRNTGESVYASIPMLSANNLNYNANIPKEKAVLGKQIDYYIEVKSADQTLSSGNAASPNIVNVIEDKEGPTYSNELPANGDSMESSRPVISVDLDDPSGVDATSLQISLLNHATQATTDYTSQAVRSENQIKLTLTSDLAVGTYTVNVSGKDMKGNASVHSWSFEITARFTGGNHYRGTTHNHTQISHDAKGDPEKALTEAEKYGYDYFAFSDHSHDIDSGNVGSDTVDHKGMPERTGGANWQQTKDLAKKYTQDGKFVVFPAFEMTSTTWGHSNVFGTSNFIDRVQDGGKYQNLKNYYAWTLTYDNIVAQFNHPAMSANAFDNFIPYDKDVDKLFTMLEVGNGSGHYSYVNADKKLFSALDLGWHVAPTYGEDNHDGTWGQTKKRTVIVAKDLSQESLLEAMRKMRVYFSEDPNFQLDMLANGYYMGSTVDSNNLTFDVTGKDPVQESATDPKYSYMTTSTNDNIKKVELLTNGGTVVDTYTPTGNETTFNWKPTVTVVGGQQWFIVKVTQMDGDQIYSSPIWSQVQPLAVKVTDLTVVEGAAIAGIPVTLKAGISNQGTIALQNLTASLYYDAVDVSHFIGESTIPSLASNKSADTLVQWQKPVAGDHKLIVVLKADGQDLGNNKYEQMISVKAPLGITVMIDATHNNENTTSDTGTYKDNLQNFTLNLKKQGYTVVENKTTLTDALLKDVAVLMVTHPSSAYSASEIDVLKTFVASGGSLLLTEKSNFGGTARNLNSLLAGVGSSILVNNDGVFDETKEGNFWGTPLTSNFSVRAHLKPVSNGLTDFVSLLDFYSGSSLAQNDGTGNKIPLTGSSTVTILASGNESTFQDSPQVKADTVTYNVQTANGKSGPALENVTGGSTIPLVASEQLGKGRILVAGMNIFNDKQMTQNDGPVGNAPFELNVVNWLAHQESKVSSISEARKLPLNTKVVIQGKVTTTAFYDAAYIQDDTGGTVIFSEVPAGSLQLGDTVRVYGHIGIFENDVEIIFDRFDNSIVKVSSGSPVQPKVLSTADSVIEQYQGQLVQVKGKVIAIPDDNSYVINDGSGDVLVFVDGYIANQTGAVPTIKVGDTLQATGLSGKYSEGSRIRVRDTRELINATDSVPVTGVTLDKTTLTFTVGEAAQALMATVNPNTATNKAVTWSSSNTAVAMVDNNGIVTPVAAGTATITVTTVDGGKTATSEVTVNAANVSVAGVTLDKTTLTFTVGGAAQALTATVNPNTATNKAVTWSSSNTAVATVDNNGVVTPVAAGTAIITVTTVDAGKTATSEVTVTTSSSGGNGGNGGNGGGNGGNTGDTGNHTTTITSDKLTNSSNGTITVEVPAATTEVKVPANTADLIKQNNLEIKSDNLTINLPSDLIKQLKMKVAPSDWTDSSISLKLDPLSQVDAKNIVDKGKNATNSDIKLFGEVYEFHLSITTASGKTYDLSAFDKPITIQLKVGPTVNAKLAAIYYISETGALEFIGGKYVNGYMVAEISHFSKYAVLQVSKLFTDVQPGYWASNAIQELVSKQILNGTSPTSFEPGRSVTRAEFTAMLVRALKLTEKSDKAFTDVSAGDWYAEAISIALKAGIVQGKSTTLFGASAQITREEMVTMLMRAYKYMNGKAPVHTSPRFTDESQISSWAAEFVKEAAALNLIQGSGAGNFKPRGITTRAEAAQVVYNLLNK